MSLSNSVKAGALVCIMTSKGPIFGVVTCTDQYGCFDVFWSTPSGIIPKYTMEDIVCYCDHDSHTGYVRMVIR